MPVKDAGRLSEAILSIDPRIISASICSLSGEEIGSAVKPSANLMIPSDDEMAKRYGSIVVSATQALAQGEKAFGELEKIVSTFRRLKVIIILNRSKEIAAVLVTTKDSESRRISFQVSTLIYQW